MSAVLIVDEIASDRDELARALEAEGFEVVQSESPSAAVRDGDWKLIEWYEDGSLELFNLRDDIGETKDLAAREPAKIGFKSNRRVFVEQRLRVLTAGFRHVGLTG